MIASLPHPHSTLQICEPTLAGRDKYLGGACDEQSGAVYCIPGSATRVLKITPSEPSPHLELLGKQDLPGKFKWLRCCTSNKRSKYPGIIYGLPSCASSILRIDPKTDHVSTFGDLGNLRWKWHGGITSRANGAIYAIPCNHPYVLRILPDSDEVSFLGLPNHAPQKWYGGIEAEDNCIYGIPNCAEQVLKIDPLTGEIHAFGNLSKAPYKWHGGVLGPDGCLYAVPSHADRVLRINPQDETTTLIGDSIPPGHHRPQGKYKYGGAVVGSNGAIYCFPSDADQVLKIDPKTEQVYSIGPRFYHHNKWQNGFLASNNCIYAIPCNMTSVLQIDCSTDQVSTLPLPEPYDRGFDKWEGGVVDHAKRLWCMPQNSKHVLCISSTPQSPQAKNQAVIFPQR